MAVKPIATRGIRKESLIYSQFFAKNVLKYLSDRARACDFKGIDIFKQREKLLSY
jgi:hypothetical protein